MKLLYYYRMVSDALSWFFLLFNRLSNIRCLEKFEFLDITDFL